MLSSLSQTRSIGQRLRQMREQQNWSQTRLAKELDKYSVNVSISSINRWENDKTVPGPYYREHLCQVFHVSAEELFGPPESTSEEAFETDARTPFWNVPYLRNRYFTGRECLLTLLHETLNTGKTGTSTALSGLGGIGKTQLIVEYAYRYVNEYDAILWARANNPHTLRTDFQALATLLDLPRKYSEDQQSAITAVIRWLNIHKHWLLILDDVDDLEHIQEFLPRRGGGKTLLSMRAYATGPNIKGIEVNTLTKEEGALLILRRSKLLNEEEELNQLPEKMRREAEQISELLGGLPLALDQVGAYVEDNQCTLADYLALYRKRAMDLLKRQYQVNFFCYPHTVATTWSMSFAQLEQAHPEAADLLRLCSFYPNAIPESMLLAGKAELGPVLRSLVTDPLAWDEAIGALRKYSLVQRMAETRMLHMHPLVQMVLKVSMDAETYQQWAERARRVYNAAHLHSSTDFSKHWN